MLDDLDHGGPTVETCRGRPIQSQAEEAQALVDEKMNKFSHFKFGAIYFMSEFPANPPEMRAIYLRREVLEPLVPVCSVKCPSQIPFFWPLNYFPSPSNNY